jgi:exonuclease V
MKQGSSVHKELEEQVHVEVAIEVVSKEDRFGLRIWNAIQGLRTLRETGLTRELEVFGVVEDEVIIGIVDEISTTCPDEAMEAAILEDLQRAKTGGTKGGKSKTDQLPADQRTLTDFLTISQNGSILENNPAFLGTLQQERPKTYYIKDIKTRQSRTLPAPGSPSRPTHMQLMLYHILLSALASNAVSGNKIFNRYSLKPEERFSDKFIAEIANLDIASAYPSRGEGPTQSRPTDPLTELLEHNNLSLLWGLLISEYALTFPTHLGQIAISPLLTAEFRTASARLGVESQDATMEAAGTLIGRRSFPFDARIIEKYVRDEMAWWKGERETKGVDIEEAFKCRICEFAESCTWRATKIEEGLQKARMRKEGRKKSEV